MVVYDVLRRSQSELLKATEGVLNQLLYESALNKFLQFKTK